MEKLDTVLKNFSLVFTNTITTRDLHDVSFYLEDKEVNYDNSISLYDVVENFNKLYLSFKKEYDVLDKLEIGDSIEIGKFVKYSRDNYRHIDICTNKKINSNKGLAKIYLVEHNKEISSYITNDINAKDKDYYFYKIVLDEDKVKKYLDLFDKYSILLYLYHHFKQGMIYGDGIYTLFTKIKSKNDNFLDDLVSFELSLSTNYYNSGDFIDVSINLGDNFGINNNSKMELDYHHIDANENDFINVLKNIFINEKYLNTYWDRVDHEEKVSAKSLIKSSNSIAK